MGTFIKKKTAFSEEVGISRKTISKNFAKGGYKISQSKKHYILESTDIQAGEQKKYYNQFRDIKQPKNSLMYLVDNVDRIKTILDGSNEYYKDITDSNIEKKEDIVKDIYNFKQAKRDYRAKTLKLDVEVQKGFERIAEDLKDSGVTQQELLNYILNQYIKFYENIK